MTALRVPISGLPDITTLISTDDFLPLVDSASLTTYRSTVGKLSGWMSQSGSVLSASWASSSVSSSHAETASYAMDYRHVQSVVKTVQSESLYTQDMARVYNRSTTVPGFHNLMVSMKVWGDIYSTAKNYLITADHYSPGQGTDPVGGVTLDGTAYSGYYEVQPLSATRNYAPNNYNTDFSLEMSQSYTLNGSSQFDTNNLYFRIRCDHLVTPYTASSTQAAAAVLTFWFLDNSGPANETYGDFSVERLANNRTLSSRDLPSWPYSFVEIKNYKMTVSGSLMVQNGVTASLLGTSSWSNRSYLADTASYIDLGTSGNVPNLASSSISSSWASASFTSVSSSWASASFSSSHAITASNANTASYLSPAGNMIKAFGTFWTWADPTSTNPPVGRNAQTMSTYNIASVAWDSTDLANPDWNPTPLQREDSTQYKVTFTNPLPNENYTVIVSVGGEEEQADLYWVAYPFTTNGGAGTIAQTATYFYISKIGGTTNNNGANRKHHWCQFVVYQA